jgi:hypothetical protein
MYIFGFKTQILENPGLAYGQFETPFQLDFLDFREKYGALKGGQQSFAASSTKVSYTSPRFLRLQPF